MNAHANFMTKLLELVDYADQHDLEVPYLALNATVELIAPSLARKMTVGSDALSLPQHRAVSVAKPLSVAKPPRDVHLTVIAGGLSGR